MITRNDVKTVLDIADRCFPGARLGGPPNPMPGDPAADFERLKGELPDHLGCRTLDPWAIERGLPWGDKRYAREFKRLAVCAAMAECQSAGLTSVRS